jgi:hypothetical protein
MFFLQMQELFSDFYLAVEWEGMSLSFIKPGLADFLHPAFLQFFTMCIHILARFGLFLEEFSRDIEEKVSIERFETLKATLIKELEKPPENLAGKALQLYHFAFERIAILMEGVLPSKISSAMSPFLLSRSAMSALTSPPKRLRRSRQRLL